MSISQDSHLMFEIGAVIGAFLSWLGTYYWFKFKGMRETSVKAIKNEKQKR